MTAAITRPLHEVDPAVGVAGEPVGVHGPGDHLAGRRTPQPVLLGLAGEHRGPDPQHHRDPPARVEPDRLGQQQRRDQQRDHERGGQQRSGCLAALQRDDQVAPDPAGHRAERAAQRRGQEEQRRSPCPTAARSAAPRSSPGPGPGPARGPAAAAARPTRRAVPTCGRRRTRSSDGRGRPRPTPRSSDRNGPGSAASCARGPRWTTRPPSSTATCSARSVVESRCATRSPVRPASSRSAARTTLASVTGSIRAVASSSTTTLTSRTSSRANATSCSSPADSVVPPGPSRVSSPSDSPATQAVEAELGDGGLDPARAARRLEERDVLGERAGQDLGALGDHADGGAQRLEVEVEHVDAAQEHRAALGLDGPREQRRQGRLAGAGAADQGAGGAGRDVQVDVLEREPPLGVGEVQVAELDVERAVRESVRRRSARARRRAARAAAAPRRSPPGGRAGAARAGRPGRRTSW